MNNLPDVVKGRDVRRLITSRIFSSKQIYSYHQRLYYHICISNELSTFQYNKFIEKVKAYRKYKCFDALIVKITRTCFYYYRENRPFLYNLGRPLVSFLSPPPLYIVLLDWSSNISAPSP